jgi:hypothetical protein
MMETCHLFIEHTNTYLVIQNRQMNGVKLEYACNYCTKS